MLHFKLETAHSFRIQSDGLAIFPRAEVTLQHSAAAYRSVIKEEQRIPMGVPGLDAMLGGGLPMGYGLLVVGPSGSGKTILATQFLAEGARQGEPGVIAAFEKSPSQLLNNTLCTLVEKGHVGLFDAHSLSLSIDETLHHLVALILQMQAKRVVLDSLSGFELILAPEFHEDFRGSLYRMVAVLTGMGVAVLMTSELADCYTELRFSPFGSAFLADAIIMQRYIEVGGSLARVMAVAKVRGSAHSKEIRFFDITSDGIEIGLPLTNYSGILSGHLVLEQKPPGSENVTA